MSNTDSNDLSWITPEQREILETAYETDPIATINAIAQMHSNNTFNQAAQLSAHHTEQFHKPAAGRPLGGMCPAKLTTELTIDPPSRL
jgi:hypothetical protein